MVNKDAPSPARTIVRYMGRRLNGEDVGAFIISENIERRRLTKGQSAVAMAMTPTRPEQPLPRFPLRERNDLFSLPYVSFLEAAHGGWLNQMRRIVSECV
jgi:hypothetical protein